MCIRDRSTAADTTAAATTAAPETTTVDAGSSGETEMTGGSLETAASATEYADDTLKQVYAAVKEAYGENYLPNMALEEQMLADSWGVDMTLVDGAYFAEVPMISADRKSTRLNSSHITRSRMPSSA